MVLALSAWQWWTPPASHLCPFQIQFIYWHKSLCLCPPHLLPLCSTLQSIFFFCPINDSLIAVVRQSNNVIKVKYLIFSSIGKSITQYLLFVSLSKWLCQPFSAFSTIDNAEILLSDSLHMSLSNLIFCHAVTSDLTVLSPGVIRMKGADNN